MEQRSNWRHSTSETVASSPRKLPFRQEGNSTQHSEREKQRQEEEEEKKKKKKKVLCDPSCHPVLLAVCRTVLKGIRTQPQTRPVSNKVPLCSQYFA
jgi:hypothetical protein